MKPLDLHVGLAISDETGEEGKQEEGKKSLECFEREEARRRLKLCVKCLGMTIDE